jgi:hypothetical protein
MPCLKDVLGARMRTRVGMVIAEQSARVNTVADNRVTNRVAYDIARTPTRTIPSLAVEQHTTDEQRILFSARS